MPNGDNELFIHADKKIEAVKNEVSDVIRSILSQGQKIDQLSERINEGVSKTAYKTFEKVNEISTALVQMRNDNEKRDLQINSVSKHVDWILRGVFIVVFVSVLAGLLATIWRFKG